MAQQSLAQLLEEARRAIQVTEDELKEARRRRELLAAAARSAFPGSYIYFNGSVAHGDANTPLTDVDLGAVLAPADADGFGPGEQSARPLMERMRDAIRESLSDEFRRLSVEVEGRRRAVLVRFGDPVTAGQEDFTADVMTALRHPSGRGLWIPNTQIKAQWDRADPITHTAMVLQAIKDTDKVFARAVRLIKHWNCKHSKPMCSWNIKALCLLCFKEPMPLIKALQMFFTFAEEEIEKGPTPDPAGVAGPIPLGLPIKDVRNRLQTARKYIDLAIDHETAGRPFSAQHALHQVLPDLVPDVDATHEEAARLVTTVRAGKSAATGLGLATGFVTPARAWAPEQ
ncbi:hypothetical protein [Streptomyces sp. NBC_01477]|uniref:hypothetical protein n=1 Tax=Streptomyces sp. NBC_01477 TaxID=2976015 RepID=UPI002E3594A9|nr:hypothetical protein [Streptomyces sp. NBC_01477]